MVARRDLYLLLWGAVYILIASYILFNFESRVWASMFFVAGAFSLVSAVYRSMWKKATAFALLAAVSALRGVSYATPYLFNLDLIPDIALGIAVLYFGITLSHMLVAGWRSGEVVETSHRDKEDRTQGD